MNAARRITTQEQSIIQKAGITPEPNTALEQSHSQETPSRSFLWIFVLLLVIAWLVWGWRSHQRARAATRELEEHA